MACCKAKQAQNKISQPTGIFGQFGEVDANRFVTQ